MKTTVFVKQIKLHTKDEAEYLQKRIVRKYVPYEEKQGECTRIVNATTLDSTGFHRHTPAQFMLFSLTLIEKYTDIEVDMNNALAEFNILDEANMIDSLIQQIPVREYSMWTTMLKMVEDDFYENERSLVSFLEHKLNTITTALEALENNQE